MNNFISIKIHIDGIVQGVGFRPFVYNLAQKYNISGFVLNSSNGVEIEASGEERNLEYFINDLKNDPPKLAVITRFDHHTIQTPASISSSGFSIKDSIPDSNRSVLISPDISICDKCKVELFNKNDRRFHYPFINCTDCGPRHTIIENIPYDRKFTSMRNFPMCRKCSEEYQIPSNRRFHAQPNACFICGPQISLLDKNETEIMPVPSDDSSCSENELINMRLDKTERIINRTIKLLKEGNIVAIKGIGGFHLAADAENDSAVKKLRERKNRYEKPLAVMSLNFEKIQTFAEFSDEDKLLLESVQRPIVLLKKRVNNNLSPDIAPCSDCFGVMLPYTPLHYLLLENEFTALVMTSGNISDEPICHTEKDAFEKLNGIADYFLVHNRDIYFRCDDSVIRNIAGDRHSQTGNRDHFSRIFIRRSRGYVPTPVFLGLELPQVLALGAELKNTICFTKNEKAFLSQHIGDLENVETLDYFEETIEHFQNILQVEPGIIAHDLHPEYLSTKWVNEKELFSEKEIIGIQHHHAHVASCMAENKLDEEVIGFAMDGTGYGTDGNIWGGEILLSDTNSFERYSHFEYLPMPGGETAIREPWRMGIGYLHTYYGNDLFNLELPFLKNIDPDKIITITQMIKKGINTYQTSSLGRLFDAVAAIINIRSNVSYEGQSAVELENLLYKTDLSSKNLTYNLALNKNNLIQTGDLLEEIISDIKNNLSTSVISLKFHNGLINTFRNIAIKVREERKLNKVVLGGGCFQNNYLVDNLSRELIKSNFNVFTHRLVPPNDGGISLGQAVIAGKRYL